MKSSPLLMDAYDESIYVAEFSEPSGTAAGPDARRRAYFVFDLLLTYLSGAELCAPDITA